MADTTVFSSFHRPRPNPVAPQRTVPDADPAVVVALAPPEAPSREAPLPEALVAEPPRSEPPLSEPSLSRLPIPGPDWADLLAVTLDCDLLGLAHPGVVSLVANLPGCQSVPLNADLAGIYRPPGFRPAPWSGFAYDQTQDRAMGIAAGTRILTARGEIEVESIIPGDSVMALRGPALLPVLWVGRSSGGDTPILISAGSLGPNTPRRNLCVGADHPVYHKSIPVAASLLVNGASIHEAEGSPPEMFHIDVGLPEIIFAEGLALSSTQRGSPQGG